MRVNVIYLGSASDTGSGMGNVYREGKIAHKSQPT